jgi:hypothetical protein
VESFGSNGTDPSNRGLPASDGSRTVRRGLEDDVTPGRRRSLEDDEARARRASLEDDQTSGRRRSLEDDETTAQRWSREVDEAPARRRSTSLDDATEQRTGRRAAPANEDGAVAVANRTTENVADPALNGRATGRLRPGDVRETHVAFWDDEATKHFQTAWHEVKAEFVDDPVTALTRAHDLLTDAVNELTESLLAERDELDPLRTTSAPDTESMRMAMRGYREFLDRILAL